MRYEGPIYRPPSEADSLLIQATVGCPHNKCTFCMVYKKGPPYKVRPIEDIIQDIDKAGAAFRHKAKTIFFPAGNTIAMPVNELAEICRHAKKVFPECRRITVYGSSQYMDDKGVQGLASLAEAGMGRIHVGLESGDDVVLERTRKGADAETQVRACRAAIEAGLEISLYVVLGLGGLNRFGINAVKTADVLNRIKPHFVRLRTFTPKINTLMLKQVQNGSFTMLTPHQVLKETLDIVQALNFPVIIASDHYTNYMDVSGRLPEDREKMTTMINRGLKRPLSDFRPVFIGDQ